jgi:tight adherence protein B
VIALAALAASLGTYLLYSALALGRSTLQPFRRDVRTRARLQGWITQAGMVGVRPLELASVEVSVFAGSAAVSWIVFAAAVPAALGGLLGAAAPIAVYRSRRRKLLDEARDAWPYLIEEMRLLTGALGRSIPVAMLEAGRKAPTAPMRAAFEAANREWQLSTDFGRACAVLKESLADPTADVVCETLLVANEIGGSDLERRLAALVEDRRVDLRHRKEAESRQSGPRFARWFVLVVPLGMALVGMSIGDGRDAYRSTGGQVAVVTGMCVVALCWAWASRIMRLPEPDRVFDR